MTAVPGRGNRESSWPTGLIPAICLALCLFASGCTSPQKVGATARPDVARPEKRKEDPDWHWFKCTFLRPGKELIYVGRWWGRATGYPIPAANVDAAGHPVESVVFVNRDIAKLSPGQVERGSCTDDGPVGKITVKKIKTSGATPGFFGKDSRGVKYLFKFDIDGWPELVTGAEAVGNRLMHALGYNVPECRIMTMQGTGTEFDGRRCAAVRFVPGEILGPWPFKDNRDLREVRALKLASAWIHNTDIKEPNSLMTWQADRLKVYLIDFGNSLGSHSIGPKSPEAGWEHTTDVDELFRQVFTLGLCGKPYDKDKKPFSKAVGLFDADLDPERWKANWPVIPFRDMTEADAKWMAGRIAAVTDDQIRAAVAAGKYTNAEDADYIAKILAKRRGIIRDRYAK